MSGAADKRLFTPGPINTSRAVKEAMLRDMGSRDGEFLATVREIRHELLRLAGATQSAGYEAVLLQGSGTFAVESVISSAVPEHGTLLVVSNGAYAERIGQIAARHRIPARFLRCAENAAPDIAALSATLADPAITHVAVVHCETSSGILNPLDAIAERVREAGAALIVDAMSSFGAYPISLPSLSAHFMVSSANKCIEGVPGFAFVLARRESLLACRDVARTVSLDLWAQWDGMERTGQFRFTPPTHALLAFRQALDELRAEGGPTGRAARYRTRHAALVAGMRAMGFVEHVVPALQSHIITTFRCPSEATFRFADFYERLSSRGLVIYPGKLTQGDCFRVGTIGRITEEDIRALLAGIREVLAEMGVAVPLRH